MAPGANASSPKRPEISAIDGAHEKSGIDFPSMIYFFFLHRPRVANGLEGP